MYRNLLGILAVFGVALFLVWLTFSASADRAADFRYVSGSEPKSLDPHIMTGQLEGRIADALFEGLMVRDPKTLQPVPGVAADFPEVSEDKRTYTFRLRPAARWSDGTPVTAHDFAWSWRRLQRPDLGAEYAYIQHMIRWAEVYNTYGGNAETIRETILPGLESLREDHPDGLGAEGWQAFLAEVGAAEALKNVERPDLLSTLTRREGRLSSTDLVGIADAIREEGARRERLFRHAEAHYGVDEGVFAVDEQTLVVELVAPCPYFLDIVAFYSSHPVPRHVVDVRDEEGRRTNEQDWFLPDKLVANGPFRLDSWRVNDRIRLVKSDTYWNADSVHLESIDALSIENQTTALNLYLTGEADWLPGNYPADLVDVLETRDDFYRNPGLGVYYYRFNTTRPPLDDPRVRLALSMAVDRELIVKEVLRLGQLPAYHLIPPGLAGYERPESRIRFDPAAARRLLEEAGLGTSWSWPDDLGILYNTSEAHKKVAEVVADQLRRNLGLQVSAYNQEWQAYQVTTQTFKYWIARAGWIGDYVDPNTFADMWVTNGGNNQTGWGSPVYDQLIRSAANVDVLREGADALLAELKEPLAARELIQQLEASGSEEERQIVRRRLRMHLFREAEAILVQDAFPIMPLYFYVWSGMVKPHVEGFYDQLEFEDGTTGENLQDIHPLRALRLDRGE